METPTGLTAELYNATGRARSDVLALDCFLASRYDPLGLFWEFWRPKPLTITSFDPFTVEASQEPLPPMPRNVAALVMERLAEFEETVRCAYDHETGVPVSDDDWALPEDHAYLAAARAFALKRTEGYSDDVRDCLRRAWAAGRLRSPFPELVYESAFSFQLAMNAVNGLVLAELSRVKRLDNEYDEALHLLALGVGYLSEARYAAASEIDEEFGY